MIVLVKYFEVYGEVLLFYLPCFVRFLDLNWSRIWCLIPFRDVFGRKMIWLLMIWFDFWLKSNGGWLILLIFLQKITSWARLLGPGLKFIFYWQAQSLILLKSLFKLLVVEFIFWATEKREVSSACHFGFEFKSSDKSLI